MATPTYLELAQMSVTGAFVDRCSVAVAKYAQYIITEDSGTANHVRRFNWAVNAIKRPRAEVDQLAIPIAMDAVFATQNPLTLGTTPDSGAGSVQVAVEATINALLLSF